jgi:TRAP-type C4-dicarboxylate transport system substrate-binding protein
MDRREFLSAAGVAASASVLGVSGTAHAEEAAKAPEGATVIRMATLAPAGSAWMKVFDAWNNSLKEKTKGAVAFHFFSGGAAGDERDAVRKMRAGQIDAAALTTSGLGQIAKSCLVLQAPGVCHSYARIDKVREKLAGDFEADFDKEGFKLLGWGDAGQGRVFSNKPIVTPADMQGTNMWAWKDDPTWQAVLKAAKVPGVELGLPEVYPMLRTGRINAFPGTSIAAVAFQWYTKAQYVTKEPRGVVIGAIVMRKDKFNALPPAAQQILAETGKSAQRALTIAIRRDDDKAYEAILGKGVKAVSLAGSMKAWDETLKAARLALVGPIYTAERLKQVEDIAATAG